MTAHDDLDLAIAGWLDAKSQSSGPAVGLGRVLDITSRRRPRPAWLAGPGSRWVGDLPAGDLSARGFRLTGLDLRWSTVVVILLLVLAIIGGAILAAGQLPPRPAPLGETGRLAYILDGVLFVADWDGRNPVPVAGASWTTDTCDTVHNEGDLWSPNGRYLAYRSGWGTGCTPTVHISDPQGKAVASWPAAVGWKVAWTPDSERVATWGTADGTIDIRGVDGVLQEQVHLPEGACVCGDRDPGWNHDGTAILMQMGMAPNGTPTRVWQLSIPDGAASPLTDAFVRGIAYSVDGSQAAYFADGSLVVASTDDLSVPRVEVKADEDGGMIWSPTGDRIAFSWTDAEFDEQANDTLPGTYELRVLDLASGSVTSLVSVDAPDPLPFRPITFGPEGDQILFSRADDLWSVKPDGSDAQLVVSGTNWGDWQWQKASP